MAEIVIPKCPNCGADIELRPDGEAGVCKYCDSQVLVIDNRPRQSESDIERKKEALELLRQDLASLQMQAAGLEARIRATQAIGAPVNARVAVFPMVMFTMMAVFGGFMAFLFYIIDISWVYGIPRAMCPVVGTVVVIIGIAGAVGSKVALGKMMESRRVTAMQSPQYLAAVAQLQALQPRIVATQQEAERVDQQLRSLVLGPEMQQ